MLTLVINSDRVCNVAISNVKIKWLREAYKLDLLNIWSSLAERCTRPLDEDDIADITTGKITLDRGVFRNACRVDFGSTAEPVPGDVTVHEGTDGEEDDVEDESVTDVEDLDAADASETYPGSYPNFLVRLPMLQKMS